MPPGAVTGDVAAMTDAGWAGMVWAIGGEEAWLTIGAYWLGAQSWGPALMLPPSAEFILIVVPGLLVDHGIGILIG